MIAFSDDAKAALVLTTRLGDAKRPSLTPKAWHALVEALRLAGGSPGAVFVGQEGLGEDQRHRIDELLGGSARVMLDLEEQLGKGIWVLTEFDDGYPARFSCLGDSKPPVIFGVGNRSLLNAGGVAIVGSRDVDEPGSEVARALAEESVRLGKPVISGAARGVDQLAMNAAFIAGGSVIGVLADALDRKLRAGEMLHALDRDSVCLITQQHPSAGFSAASAYSRNKLVYVLADMTIVVASAEDEGGTWKGAEEALRLKLPVAVWRGDGQGSGNERLEAMGARPLKAVTNLADVLGRSAHRPEPEQLKIL